MGYQLRVRMLEVLLFPFLIFPAALDVGDEWVEGYGVVVRMVMRRRECVVGAKLEAAMAMV